MLTRVIHPDDADTCYRSNHGICGIPSLLQQLGPNVTANVALGCDSTQMTWLQCRRCSILRASDWITKDGLQRQDSREGLVQAGRHGGREGVEGEKGQQQVYKRIHDLTQGQRDPLLQAGSYPQRSIAPDNWITVTYSVPTRRRRCPYYCVTFARGWVIDAFGLGKARELWPPVGCSGAGMASSCTVGHVVGAFCIRVRRPGADRGARVACCHNLGRTSDSLASSARAWGRYQDRR